MKYVKRNFLAGRDSMRITEANRKVLEWVERVAGQRIHGTVKWRPLERFEAVERETLQPLPTSPYDNGVWKQVKLHRDCHVIVDGAYYSAPHRLIDRQLWARTNERDVVIATMSSRVRGRRSFLLKEARPLEVKAQLIPKLKALRLSGILETLEVRNRQAIDDKLSYVEFLERLLEDEVERRGQKQLMLRLRRASFTSEKTLEGFDWSFNPSINRQHILDLAVGTWIDRHENVLIVGPSGVGKSHLAQALGQEACRRGYHVLFTPVLKMLSHLHGGRADGTYDRRRSGYLRPDLLILDDFGLRALRPQEAEDFYQVVGERYERGSILVTSNRDYGEWPEAFGENALLASAGLDRLAHQAHLITITGASYRAHQTPPSGKENRGGQPRTAIQTLVPYRVNTAGPL